jgi:hypothetical protein
MGLYRTALRLATLEALRPTAQLTAESPVWPTLAADWVFDSRIDPLEDDLIRQGKPRAAIAVYTDGDLGYGSQHRGGPPFRRVVDLCFDISQIAWEPAGNTGEYVAGIPLTDAELEAELDRIESEIALALLYAPGGKIWRQLTGSMVTDPHTTPHRDSEEGARLAWRSMVWKVQVPDDAFDGLPLEIPVGLNRLPQPLRGVAEQLMNSSYGVVIAQALGISMPTMPVATPLKTVTLGQEVLPPGEQHTGNANVAGVANLDGVPLPPAAGELDFSQPGNPLEPPT